jgi:osmotically-inducible protein OsmY
MTPDEQIKKQVVEKLYWDDRVNAADVRVWSDGGKVVLSGSVPSYQCLKAAEHDAWSVPGVKMVENRLTILYPAEEQMPTAEEVRAGIERKLQWSRDIDPTTMEVSVTAGVATLKGTVDSYWKKDKAEILAYDVIGVTLVENKLAVVPSRAVIDEAIGESVTAAIDRIGAIDINALDIKVENRTVTLSGTVPHYGALQAARDAAIHTLGVVDVEIQLVIYREPATVD